MQTTPWKRTSSAYIMNMFSNRWVFICLLDQSRRARATSYYTLSCGASVEHFCEVSSLTLDANADAVDRELVLDAMMTWLFELCFWLASGSPAVSKSHRATVYSIQTRSSWVRKLGRLISIQTCWFFDVYFKRFYIVLENVFKKINTRIDS